MEKQVAAFIEALKKDNPGCEAVLLRVDGNVRIEHHFVPSKPRCIYSHTKNFTATAVGMALDEGLLSLDDRAIDRFPAYADAVVDQRMKTVTLRHLLTMSSGIGESLLAMPRRAEGEGCPDYLTYFFSRPLRDDPGTRFCYSNADAHMAGWMVARAAGETLQRYLYRRLFVKLGIGYPGWEADPLGNAFGASGMYLSIRDMGKLGLLFLNDGVWNGERLLSSDWVREATRTQITTGEPTPWTSGYGYQFWIIEDLPGAYRADGAYGQLSAVLPEKRAVLSVQCGEENDTARFFPMFRAAVHGQTAF